MEKGDSLFLLGFEGFMTLAHCEWLVWIILLFSHTQFLISKSYWMCISMFSGIDFLVLASQGADSCCGNGLRSESDNRRMLKSRSRN